MTKSAPSARIDLLAASALTAEAFSPCGEQRWGLEQEWVIRRPDDPGHRATLEDLGPVLAEPLPGGSSLTVEPGGQVELSTTANLRLDQTLDGLALDRRELAARLSRRGFVMVDDALDLVRPPQRILSQPRYRCMEAFFDTRGPAGRWMMCNTAGLQLNVSHDPLTPQSRWELVHRLGPVLVATFACSPGRDANGQSWASLRQGIWSAIDPGRTRPVTSGSPGPAWLDYALAADVMLIHDDADNAETVLPGMSFEHWMVGDDQQRPPTAADLRYHLTTLFPPVRPRGWLELRMIDALPATAGEVAALVVAAALQPRVAAALREHLPDTSGWWVEAARHGLAHDGLAEAAQALFHAVQPALPDVTERPERIDAVRTYAETHVEARLQPWGDRPDRDDAPQTPVDLTEHVPLAC